MRRWITSTTLALSAVLLPMSHATAGPPPARPRSRRPPIVGDRSFPSVLPDRNACPDHRHRQRQPRPDRPRAGARHERLVGHPGRWQLRRGRHVLASGADVVGGQAGAARLRTGDRRRRGCGLSDHGRPHRDPPLHAPPGPPVLLPVVHPHPVEPVRGHQLPGEPRPHDAKRLPGGEVGVPPAVRGHRPAVQVRRHHLLRAVPQEPAGEPVPLERRHRPRVGQAHRGPDHQGRPGRGSPPRTGRASAAATRSTSRAAWSST